MLFPVGVYCANTCTVTMHAVRNYLLQIIHSYDLVYSHQFHKIIALLELGFVFIFCVLFMQSGMQSYGSGYNRHEKQSAISEM